MEKFSRTIKSLIYYLLVVRFVSNASTSTKTKCTHLCPVYSKQDVQYTDLLYKTIYMIQSSRGKLFLNFG